MAEEGQEHPISTYLWVWLLLFVLSAFSYAVDYIGFQGFTRWSLVLLFMFLKAYFICAVFMHIILLKARYYNNHYFDSADFFQFYLPIIIIGLILPFGILYILHQKRMVILSITFFIFLLTSLLALNYLKNHPEKLDYKNNYTNINARYGKWLSAVNIIKQKPFLGSGIGDRQDDLIKQYNGNLSNAFKESKTKFFIISFTSDWLYPTSENKEIVIALNSSGADVGFIEINSDKGHDSFLLDVPDFLKSIKNFVEANY